jgi:polyphosphate kinase 2
VALPAPSDREKTQVYVQRYITHFPAAGEIILFDRSWYNRAGVERVMGFCSDEEYERFLKFVPAVEREVIVNNGIILRKYFLDVSQDEQRRRFEARIDDPVKHWKLSPMDVESVRRWWDYTEAYQRMIEATHTPEAPWHIVPADNKRRARLNLIRHLLDSIPYKKVEVELPKIPKAQPQPKNATEGLRAGQPIPSHYRCTDHSDDARHTIASRLVRALTSLALGRETVEEAARFLPDARPRPSVLAM